MSSRIAKSVTRSAAWLSGEIEVLGDVAERTPKDALYDRVVGKIVEVSR